MESERNEGSSGDPNPFSEGDRMYPVDSGVRNHREEERNKAHTHEMAQNDKARSDKEAEALSARLHKSGKPDTNIQELVDFEETDPGWASKGMKRAGGYAAVGGVGLVGLLFKLPEKGWSLMSSIRAGIESWGDKAGEPIIKVLAKIPFIGGWLSEKAEKSISEKKKEEEKKKGTHTKKVDTLISKGVSRKTAESAVNVAEAEAEAKAEAKKQKKIDKGDEDEDDDDDDDEDDDHHDDHDKKGEHPPVAGGHH